MKKIETLRQLQLAGIYIYKKLLDVCSENGLGMYIIAGTLLGAVRHKGFIPWDDDIDVCMSRPDYNRLLEITSGRISEDCHIIDPSADKDYKGVVPVAVYDNSYLESKQFKGEENLKISISIFVVDGIRNNPVIKAYYYSKMYFLRAEHALCRADFKHVNTKAARIVGPILSKFYSEKSVYKYKNKVLRWQQKYSFDNCEYVSTNADVHASREVLKKTGFGGNEKLEFEGMMCPVFANYRGFLESYYGDYMTPPPESSRKPKHGVNAMIDDAFDFDSVL